MDRFYVYCLFRPWNGEPCYIGKGKGSRYAAHSRCGTRHTNGHLAAIFNKAAGLGMEVPVVVVHTGLSEGRAFAYEVALIAAIGRTASGGPLVNLTDGGEGASGVVHHPGFGPGISARKKAQWKDPVYREAAEEHLRAISAKGMAALADIRADPDRRKAFFGHKGWRHTPEAIEAGRQKRTGQKRTPEQKKKMSDARLAANAARAARGVKSPYTNPWDSPDYRARQVASRAASAAYQNRASNRRLRAS